MIFFGLFSFMSMVACLSCKSKVSTESIDGDSYTFEEPVKVVYCREIKDLTNSDPFNLNIDSVRLEVEWEKTSDILTLRQQEGSFIKKSLLESLEKPISITPSEGCLETDVAFLLNEQEKPILALVRCFKPECYLVLFKVNSTDIGYSINTESLTHRTYIKNNLIQTVLWPDTKE